MDNYESTLDAARRHFLEYDIALLAKRPGITDAGDHLKTRFFAQTVRIEKSTGQVTLDGEKVDFVQGLSIYDWLCDRKPGAAAAGEYCPVGSLPGVFVGGSGLQICPKSLADAIQRSPEAFQRRMESMGATPVSYGDIGYRLEIFPGLHMLLKFYFADEEFPPSLMLLWDRNMLQFVRYETIYYIAGCLNERLRCL